MNELTIADVTTKLNTMHKKVISQTMGVLQLITEIGEILTNIKESIPHGEFTQYIESNLIFSVRTAQRYMKIYENKDKIEGVNIEKLSDAYKLLTNPKEESKKPEPIYDQEEEYEEELPDERIVTEQKPEFKEKHEANIYDYWEVLRPLIDYMIKTYELLATTRNHNTPAALGNMIGNIYEMAMRLKTWNPEYMTNCPVCNGTGQIIERGKKVKCENCINGKVGLSRPSDY